MTTNTKKAAVKTTRAKKSETSAYGNRDALTRYENLVAKFGVERKGAKNPYTSINGNMFSFLTPEGDLAVRLSDADRAAFTKKFGERPCIQYGAVMREYVQLPSEVFHNARSASSWFKKSVEYSRALKPKATKK